MKNPYALTFGSNTYDGSAAKTITASDLGALTAHQTIYTLSIIGDSTTVSSFTPNSANNSITFAAGSNISITPDTTNKKITIANTYSYTHPTGGADATITAANGRVLSAITINSLGHTTSVSYKALAAADIPSLDWSKITSGKPTTLAGYGITDGVNSVTVNGTGNAITAASISNHILTLTKGATYLPKATFDDLFEKVNIGTSSSPVYAIRAKYGLYSDEFISAKGINSSSGGGSTNALYQLVDVAPNANNDGVLNASTGKVLMYNGSKWQAGDVVSDISTLTFNVNGSKLFDYNGKSAVTANLTVPTKLSQLTDDIVSGKYLPLSGGTLTGDLYVNSRLYGPVVGSNPRTWYDATLHLFNSNPATTSSYNFGLYQWNDELQFTYRKPDGSYLGTAFTIQGNDGQVAFTKTPKVGSTLISLNGHTHSYLPLSGGTLTNNLTIQTGGIWVQGGSAAGGNNTRMELTSGTPSELAFNTSRRGVRLYSNAIALADPYNGNNNNDSGWIRHLETIGNSGTLEIAVGDDGDESVVVRQYNTSNIVVREAYLLNSSGKTSFPGTVHAPEFVKSNSSNSFILLGGGGHKAVSDFAISGHTHSYLPLSGGTVNGDLSVTGKVTFLSEAKLKMWNVTSTRYSAYGPEMVFIQTSIDGADPETSWPSKYRNDLFLQPKGGHVHIGPIEIAQDETCYIAGTLRVTDTITAPTFNGTATNADMLDGYRLTPTTSSYVNPWSTVPVIKSDGVMEIGRYLDFHFDNTSNLDYSCRLQTDANNQNVVRLPSGSGTLALTTDNVASATNASQLGGLAPDAFARYVYLTNQNLNDLTTTGLMAQAYSSNATSDLNYPIAEAGTLINISSAYSSTNQIYMSFYNNRMFIRGSGTGTSSRRPWREMAGLDSNVASATKLQTARTIWGQSFDGTADVNGPIRVYYKSTDWGNWNEGIRLYGSAKDGTWSNIHFGCDPSATVGSHANQWMIGRNHLNQFGIFHGTGSSTGVIHIDANNNVGIDTSSPAYKLDVAGSIYAGGLYSSNINTSTTSSYMWAIYQWNDEVQFTKRNASTNAYIANIFAANLSTNLCAFTFNISSTGAITAKASSSDIRLKTDITDYKALDIIRNHRSIKYHWNEAAKANADIFNDNDWHFGLIAQEMQQDLPQMVSDVFKDYLVINYERLIPICWKGLQEVDDEVTRLKKKVRKLEMEIRELKQERR